MAATAAPKKKRVPLPGESLGYPMYHSVSGNLPVLTHKFHSPVDGTVTKPSDYDYMTGNLPILSKELAVDADDDLMPGWVQLRDPVLQRLFWWNIFFRSRRETRPSPLDDGRRGAGRGEADGRALAAAYRAHVAAGASSAASAANWEEHFSPAEQRLFYCNRALGLVAWERPAAFDDGGVPYLRRWALRSDAADGSAPYYWNARTSTRSDGLPADYDGPHPLDCWQAIPDPESGTEYYYHTVLGSTQWDKPEGWPRPAPAALPSMPPLSDGVSSAMAALSLLVTGGGGVDDADTEAGEDATLVYPSFQGYLRKEGGGLSLLGRRSWKDRYFVLQGGLLSYYTDQGASEAGAEPLKEALTLRYFAVDAMLSDPKRFALVPLPSAPADAVSRLGDDDGGDDGDASAVTAAAPPPAPAATAAAAAGASSLPGRSRASSTAGAAARGAPVAPSRVFLLEAPSRMLKARWVVRLRGRRADGRHRADSDDVQAFVAADAK